ncbi:uncharacterized protein LOC116118324 [Pistacia vera]|uniref:uncharacterized protein LOC116118324 n=1 Tax=Pistacia vera TaxID=55513 RepID=UPI0012633631|nr:uncharacterized protein LOC116118324 [Pistacia vera]
MPKSKKLFKLNWASSEPREKKLVSKPIIEKKSMGKSTSGVSSSWADKVRVTEVRSYFTLEVVDLDKYDILHIPNDVIDDNDVEWLRLEYEWTPKRCPNCCVFGHVYHQPEVPTAAIAQGKSKIVTSFQKAPGKATAVQSENCEPLRQSATIDPIRERERERDVLVPSRVSVPRSWNIRGLNGFSKQRVVRNWISASSLGLIGLLETKVEQSHLYLHCSLQEITCKVTHVSEGFSFGITFVYGSNDPGNRRNLWDFLRDQSTEFDLEGLPWLVLGDFNAILGASDRVGGDPAWYGYMDDFGQCIHDAELIGVPFIGLRYTWHNSQQGDRIILQKLDWAFTSLSWILDRSNTVSEFRPRDVSDHSSMVVRFGPRRGKAVWDEPIVGNPMFRLTQKLGLLKWKLKSLHIRVSSHISSKWSRVQWLNLEDQNTKFFHKSLIHRQVRNCIHSLTDGNGTHITDSQGLGPLTVGFFKDLLAAFSQPQITEASMYFSRCISPDMISPLTAPITDDEIRIALFSILDDKALGLDGFTSLFFKWAWDIIGIDFKEVVRHFFATNEMPRCVNATKIALVPKVESPSHMTNFRPISCCNVLYKCISKMIVNRFKVVLLDIIGVS